MRTLEGRNILPSYYVQIFTTRQGLINLFVIFLWPN